MRKNKFLSMYHITNEKRINEIFKSLQKQTSKRNQFIKLGCKTYEIEIFKQSVNFVNQRIIFSHHVFFNKHHLNALKY